MNNLKLVSLDSKSCNICKEIKSLSDFIKDKRNVSGFAGQCKKCNPALGAFEDSIELLNKAIKYLGAE